MKLIAFDTETHLIKPGCITPRLVCLSADDGINSTLFLREEGLDYIESCLNDSNVSIVGHHVFFDLAVIAASRPRLLKIIWRRLEQGKILDTKILDMIISNASGELYYEIDEFGEAEKKFYRLADLAKRYLNIFLKKGDDTWRLRYSELDGIPIENWPKNAISYAKTDAEITRKVYCKQREIKNFCQGEKSQLLAGWALYLISVWGVRTNLEQVTKFSKNVEKEYEKALASCIEKGFVKEGKKKYTRNLATVRKTVEETADNPLRTPTGKIATSKKAIKDIKALKDYSSLMYYEKLRSTYLPILNSGTKYPINPSYNPIIASYRTSCSKPNMQNPPRAGGFRECFVPRDGWVYIFSDYDFLELRTLAQICFTLFKYSRMKSAIEKGVDPHLSVAATMLRISYEDAEKKLKEGNLLVKEHRQLAKIANFGFPGGMGAKAFVDYADGYGVSIDLNTAMNLQKGFIKSWPEMREYFQYCSALLNFDKYADITFFGSKLVRGKTKYTAICNGFFQELAAYGAKRALAEVSRQCYVDDTSPLYGCRPVFFLHDEIGLECPYMGQRASDCAKQLSSIMITEMSVGVPDVPITTEPVMTRKWYKDAKPVYEDGILVPSKPKHMKDSLIWISDR